MDRFKSFAVACKGGLILNADPLTLATQMPGAATRLVNYESSPKGGYRRIGGHEKFDPSAVPGTGNVIGVALYNQGVVACRGTNVYYTTGGGAGWGTAINTSARTGAIRYRFVRYNWNGTPKIIMVDGANFPASWDGTTYTLLNGTNAPTNPKYVEEFANHIFYSGYSSNSGAIRFSAPLDETEFRTSNGAGELVVGDTVVGLKRFRDSLIIFCTNSIYQLQGTSSANFALSSITKDIGCVAADSIQEIAGDLVFLAPDGIRPLGATMRIGDVQIASVSRQIQPLISGNRITSFSNICSSYVPSLSVYRLYYNDSLVPTQDARGVSGSVIRGDVPTPAGGSWEWAEITGIKPFTTDSGYLAEEEFIIFGGWDGYVYRQERGGTFDGQNIQAIYVSSPLIMEDPNIRKVPRQLQALINIEDPTIIEVRAIYDLNRPGVAQPGAFSITLGGNLFVYGSAIYGTATYSQAESTVTSKNYIVGSGMYVQFAFTSTDPNNSHSIQGFTIEYSNGNRR